MSYSSYLMQHQKDGAMLAGKKPRWLYAYETGTGKTALAIEIVKQKRLKTLVICPLSIIEAAWMADLSKFAPELGALNLWKALKSSKFKWDMLAKYNIVIINYESFKKQADNLKAQGFQILLLDECFVPGTLIDTPLGQVPIESINSGDEIINCTGVDVVTDTFIRTIELSACLVTITINGISMITSASHLFFTMRGWIEAQYLTEKDYVIYTNVAMRNMQGTSDGRSSKATFQKQKKTGKGDVSSFLWEILLREMENVSTGTSCKGLYKRSCEKNKQENQNIHEFRHTDSIGPDRADQSTLPDIRFHSKGKNFYKAQRNGPQASRSGREWKNYTCPRAYLNRKIKRIISTIQLEIGTRHIIKLADSRWISNLLQGGHCLPVSPAGNRSRRIQSHGNVEEGTGYKEKCKTIGVRVDSIKIYKSTDSLFDKYRNNDGRVILYDLAIKKHPSFSVNGFVVHNSSKLKESRTAITKVVTKFAADIKHVYLFSGTPAPNSPMEYFSQIKIVNPNILGFSFYKFRATYFINYGYGGFQWKINPDREQFLMDAIVLCSSVVRKEDVLDLPERTDNIRTVYLSAGEKAAYEKMKNDMLLQIEQGEISAANAAVKIMKLRQITSGFLLGEIDQIKQVHPLGTSKEVALMELLEEIGSHQAIIWTQFHEEARRLLKLLGARAAVINGAVKQEDRDVSIQAFKANRLQYLIAHPRSMGHGVTLTNCSYAIYYSLDYSHEAHSQSRDRIYRYGQRNACTYYYLLADKTIDGVILKALNAKSNVEKAVFDYIRKGKTTNSDRFVATNDKVVAEMTNFNEFIGDFEEQGIEL